MDFSPALALDMGERNKITTLVPMKHIEIVKLYVRKGFLLRITSSVNIQIHLKIPPHTLEVKHLRVSSIQPTYIILFSLSIPTGCEFNSIQFFSTSVSPLLKIQER